MSLICLLLFFPVLPTFQESCNSAIDQPRKVSIIRPSFAALPPRADAGHSSIAGNLCIIGKVYEKGIIKRTLEFDLNSTVLDLL